MEEKERVQVIHGDILKDKLGLSEEKYVELAQKIGGIMNCAAKVDHISTYSDGGTTDMRAHNVKGMMNILKFAAAQKTKFLFFSSSLVSAKADKSGNIIEEYLDKEDVPDSRSWGYLISKSICEKLVLEATQRGIPITTVRFPLIIW